MNILAIDTTTKTASVALLKKSKLFEKEISNEITHSEKLLPLVDQILTENNVDITNIDMFACLSGPGSFTGVRIGLATIKGLSMVNKKTTFAINSLEALALTCYLNNGLNKDKYVLSLIDAKNDRAYYSLYKIMEKYDDEKSPKLEIISCINPSNDTIFNILQNVDYYFFNNRIVREHLVICGDCTEKFSDIVQSIFKSNKSFNLYPKAKDIISIYHNISNVCDYMFDTYTLDAKYVRPSQAERTKNDTK